MPGQVCQKAWFAKIPSVSEHLASPSSSTLENYLMEKRSDNQASSFLKYLSLAPVLAVLAISIAFSTWVIINSIIPDMLYSPLP